MRGLAGADDLASVLPLILSLTCEFARFSYGCYWSVDQQSRALHRVVGYGASSAVRSVLVAGEPAPDWLEAEPVWLAGDADGAAWSSALVVPVAAGGSIIGVLEFRSSETAVAGRRVPARAARRHRAARTSARPRDRGRAAAREREPLRVDDGARRDRHFARRRRRPFSLRESAAVRDARLRRARAAGAHRQGNLAPR